MSEEFDGIEVHRKTIEEFRSELTDSIFLAIKEETANSTTFMKSADYFSVKLSEAKIEGIHKALNIIIEASIIEVKE